MNGGTGEKPKIFVLYCGAGGACRGYELAGFEVVGGMDIAPQPHYPYPFYRGDVTDWEYTRGLIRGSGAVAVSASPPCQLYSDSTLSQRNAGKQYPDLIGPTREFLNRMRLPWVMENVPKAPMRADYRLCGCMFGLNLRRERWFETSWHGFQMNYSHDHRIPAPSVVGHGTPSWVRQKLGYNPTIADYRAAMGIDWMNRDELSQAIPPAYTELIGRELLSHLEREAMV